MKPPAFFVLSLVFGGLSAAACFDFEPYDVSSVSDESDDSEDPDCIGPSCTLPNAGGSTGGSGTGGGGTGGRAFGGGGGSSGRGGSSEVVVVVPPVCDPPMPTCSPCQGCRIDGECVGSGVRNAANPCQVCDPDSAVNSWSNWEGECDDGLFCTDVDQCEQGVCTGTERQCEDGIDCNGISTCDEASDFCSPEINQCPPGEICDAELDRCGSTCSGCLIANVCRPSGAEQAGNPCLVCDPTQAVSAFTPALGKSCGTAASECSGQDTCDASGSCQPNHRTSGSGCGDSAASACDQPDACDGNGNCARRLVGNGTTCDDGQFCTIGDECQGGSCLPTENRNCGALRTCNESTNQCVCQGCVINGACVASGTLSATNACLICDPARNANAFSPKPIVFEQVRIDAGAFADNTNLNEAFADRGVHLSFESPVITGTVTNSTFPGQGTFFIQRFTEGSLDGTWTDDPGFPRFLRIRFDAPTRFVSLDAIEAALRGIDPSHGVMEAYDAGGNLLTRSTTPDFVGSAVRVLSVTRPTSDITSVLAYGTSASEPLGIDTPGASLSNLRFDRQTCAP